MDNSLASLTNKHGLTTLSSHVYTYDALGNRSTQTETVGATITNYAYGYDTLNRLTQVQNGTATQQENYQYDPIGNRTTKSIGATTPSITAYVYDTANQLKEIRSGTATGTLLASLTYDADGNLKSRSDTGLTLNYDALNRLSQATVGGQTQSYSYDDQGRRISKTVGTTTTHFLYNDADILAEYPTGWGLPTAQYTHGARIDDTLIRATATSAQYFHEDGLGSVVGITNAAGLTDATQRFDAWGNKLASTGTAPRYGYTGREPDETGLVYYRARYYDPTVGRFTQRDPIGLRGGLNRYSYVANDPCNATDPSGLLAVTIGGSLRIPGWVQYIIPGYIGQGAGGGVIVSFSNGKFDFGGYATVQGGGSDYGIGKGVISIGVQGGSVSDYAGTGGDFSAHYGPGGVTINFDGQGSFTGGSIDVGWGYNVGGSGSVTGTWSVNDGFTSPNSNGTNSQQSEHGGGATVGGLYSRHIVPAAPYSGNQK